MTPEQFKALGLKVGDTVRIVIEGLVTEVKDPAEYRHTVRLVGPSGSVFWSSLEDAQSIEVLPAPFKVGDRVTWGSGVTSYPIVHIDLEMEEAVVYRRGAAFAIALSALRRADA